MANLQWRQRPLRAIYEKRGTLSYQAIVVLHSGHRERPAMNDSPRTLLSMVTFKKLPTTIPSMKSIAIVSIISPAYAGSMYAQLEHASGQTDEFVCVFSVVCVSACWR